MRLTQYKTLALLLTVAGAAWALAGCGGGGGGSSLPGEATLSVRSTPAGAQIFIDGTDTGQVTPADVKQMAASAGSQFQVRISLAGYDDVTTTVTARPNQKVPVEATLTIAEPPVIPPHTITGKVLRASGSSTVPVPDATVVATETTSGETFTATLDTATERAGTYYIFAPAGAYTVTASKTGYQAQSRQVTIVSGEDRQTGIDFTLPPG